MMILLVAILLVAAISMAFNVAYILHELGWFPHGKPRDERSELFASPSLTTGPMAAEQRAGTLDLVTDHPSGTTLRRFAHPDVYEYEDPATKLAEVLQRAKESPSPSSMDDLLTLSNVIGSRSAPTEEIDRLLSAALALLQDRELKAHEEGA